MNKIFSIIRSNILVSMLLGCIGLGVFTSCSDDDSAPTNFYSSLRMTAAEKISSQPERFSMFKEVLDRNNYLSLLSTYGMYTVFVPDNNAMTKYLTERNYSSVAQLPDKLCDTIARMHIVSRSAFFSTDMSSKSTPMNMNDIYLEMTSKVNQQDKTLELYVNKQSRIIQKDDSVTNGVVHVVDKVIKATNKRLPDFMEEDPEISIFCAALRKTGMADSLMKYIDESYPDIPKDSTEEMNKPWYVFYGSSGSGPKMQETYYPAKRFFKYSAFVEKDETYKQEGINSLEDLEEKVKEWLGPSYPEDASVTDPTDRRNYLNRFVSYHLINRMGLYEDWVIYLNVDKNPGLTGKFRPSEVDPEDYFETMMPHSIMRFSVGTDKQLYINRYRKANRSVQAGYEGIRVNKPSESSREMQTENGNYFYIDGILKYDLMTRNEILNNRLRIDASSLSPDFMNSGSGARAHHIVDDYHKGTYGFMMGFKRGYVTDFDFTEQTTLGCRYEDPTWRHYEGNGVCISGKYDIKIKLPAVPCDGVWELRLGYTIGEDRGAAQIYLAELDDNTTKDNARYDPCGVPVDFTYSDLSYIGWEAHSKEDAEYNKYLTKAMRNRGYMKAPLVIADTDDIIYDGGWSTVLRRILVRQQFSANKTYWLRMRQIVDDPLLYMSLDYIELVPKSYFDDPAGEDDY